MFEIDQLEAKRQRGEAEIVLLRRACELKPQELRPFILLGNIAQSSGDVQTLAVSQLEKIRNSNSAPAQLDAVIGSSAAQNGDYAKAEQYLKRACESHPEDAQAHNNLAWVYLQLGGESLQKGLVLANRAVEIRPEMIDYRETRGQLLVKLNKAQEAVADLEIVLNGMKTEASADVHRSLADAYEQLGQKDLAAVHRQQSR